jgi:hypothetical protein
MTVFQELTPDKARTLIDAEQLYQAYLHAFRFARSYRGGMHWKDIGGQKYLYKTLDSRGTAKSLGAESEETRRIHSDFKTGKASAEERLKTIAERLKQQAALCKAVKINRTPSIVTAILRQAERAGWLGKNLVVIGTNALYAYEAAASIRFDREITATGDVDFLWDARSRLVFAGDADLKSEGFIGLLRKADRSFAPVSRKGFRAVNKNGYFVDLVKPAAPFWEKHDPAQIGENDEIRASEIISLKWLVASPKMSQVVIGEDGFPAIIVVPDPRAFAVYKLWLSRQADREPVKKQRDYLQAIAVARTVVEKLPNLQFSEQELRMFPGEVWRRAQAELGNLPSGFELP